MIRCETPIEVNCVIKQSIEMHQQLQHQPKYPTNLQQNVAREINLSWAQTTEN